MNIAILNNEAKADGIIFPSAFPLPKPDPFVRFSEHPRGVAFEPLLDHGVVHGAEIDLVFQVAVLEICQARHFAARRNNRPSHRG